MQSEYARSDRFFFFVFENPTAKSSDFRIEKWYGFLVRDVINHSKQQQTAADGSTTIDELDGDTAV